MILTLHDVYHENGNPKPGSILFLKQLLEERPHEANISHDGVLPSQDEHAQFVKSWPYRRWFIVKLETLPVGSVYCTRMNEIGVAIAKDQQRKGYGFIAVTMLMREIDPLPEIKGWRHAGWVAHVAPENTASIELFSKALGGTVISMTYSLP